MPKNSGHNLTEKAFFDVYDVDQVGVFCTCDLGEPLWAGPDIDLQDALKIVAEHNGENLTKASF